MTPLFNEAVAPLLRRLAAFAAIALGAACQPIDAAIDCNTICTRYKDCFDGTYDVASCATRCRAKAANNSATYTTINRCEACIDDRACASATFNCNSDCSEVVP